MLIKIATLLLSLFIFLGCSSKSNPYADSKDVLHEQAITQTKKVSIKYGEKIKAFITATYLNQIEHKLAGDNKKLERFIVNIYIPSSENQKLYNEINIKINGIETRAYIEELKNDNPLLKILAFITPWSRHYLIEIPKIKTRELTLSFDTSLYDTVKLSFKKDYL